MQRSEFVIPPSTASSASALPLSFDMASRIALVWKHVASRVALAMCPFCVYAVMPTFQCQLIWSTGLGTGGNLQMVPRASSIQYGANNPLNAVTNVHPPLSGTVSAS